MIALTLSLLLGGCNSGAPECIDNGDCGDKEACLDDKCKAVECIDSAGCGLHSFCDPRDYVCRQGCTTDDDCAAGEACNADEHKCASYGCRNTVLDCNIGENCDESTHQCLPDNRGHCDSCDPWEQAMGGSPCGNNAYCWSWDASGNVGYCLVDCRPSVPDCPNGYQCGDVTGSNDWACYADCQWLEQNGWL